MPAAAPQEPAKPRSITLWPWITAVATCLAAFNPVGIEIISAALNQSPSDWFRHLWLTLALMAAGVAAILAFIEILVRVHLNKRGSAR